MAKAKFPDYIPGDFFVLVCEKSQPGVLIVGASVGRFRFTLIVDDDDQSTYDLGSNLSVIFRRFELWGLGEIGREAIDRARNFGTVQVIPAQNRIINIFDRDGKKIDPFKREKKEHGYRSLTSVQSSL